jgi:CRP/FNR family transcriptional regulator
MMMTRPNHERKIEKLKIVSEVDCNAVACRNCGICRLGTPLDSTEADPRLLERIAKNRRQVKRGDLLYRIGEPLKAIYAIRYGSIKTYLSTVDGRSQITGFHIAGDPLGLADLHDGLCSTEARALENTSLCEIPIEHLQLLTEELPALRVQLTQLLSQEVQRLQGLSLLLGKKTAEERLATFLITLSRRFARRGYSSREFNLSMSRNDIGTYLGIVEETVCRTLARFQDEGLIDNQRRLICVLDADRLARLAQI